MTFPMTLENRKECSKLGLEPLSKETELWKESLRRRQTICRQMCLVQKDKGDLHLLL